MNLSKHRPFAALLAAFFALTLVYAWATPPFEASDELWHVGMVNHIAETGQLAVQAPGTDTPYEQEGSQPPLYYALGALLVRSIDRSDFEAVRQPNPHAVAGIPGYVGGKNLILRDSPHPPLQGTILAVYVLRAFSILLGCVTVCAVYAAARTLAPERGGLALLAAGLTAFNPMFVFITASVNNDNLVTALNSLVIWQMLVMLRAGRITARRSLIIAVLIALAALSKLSGLVLVPALALAGLWLAVRPMTEHKPFDWRGLVMLGGAMAATWALLAGWWYLRNLTLYGELFGTHTMALVAGVRAAPFTLSTLLDEFQGFRFAYWALFGAVNIMTFRWFYDVMDALTVVAFVGAALPFWRALRRRERDWLVRHALLGLIVLTGCVSIAAWTAQTYASQGRLLFPFVAAISVLLATGLLNVGDTIADAIRRTWRNNASLKPLPISGVHVIVAALGVFALVVPIASIAPEYAAPVPLLELPGSAQQVYARFGGVALVGYEALEQRYQPGEQVPITLYWQVLDNADERDYSLYLHATLDDGRVIGKVDSYPGGGRLRTSHWQQGALYSDTYAIPLTPDAAGISRLRVQVGWWHYASGERVEAVDADGAALNSVMLNAGGFAPQTVEPVTDAFTEITPVSFGGVRLTGYQLDGNALALIWESSGALSADYTVFAQVIDAEGTIIGQGDAPPALPTRFWRSGERFITRHNLAYQQPPTPGNYQLLVGWYNPVDFARLDVAAPNDAYPLALVVISG
ncbi:MAG: DUF2142 domain-containing protein [Anaerolineae bacterium]|nr:DUF2142 domain-containing protein [Anaerolineae bacterium]